MTKREIQRFAKISKLQINFEMSFYLMEEFLEQHNETFDSMWDNLDPEVQESWINRCKNLNDYGSKLDRFKL